MRMDRVTCIEDLRELHRRCAPRAFFDYVDHGSYAEQTLRANRDDLSAIRLRQRVMVDISRTDLSARILGESRPLPLMLAPVGLTGMQYRDGEIAACRAAQARGLPYCLSTLSICSIEDVAAAVDQPFWFQLYVMKDREVVRSLLERAAAAGCDALVLTVDLQMIGQRHADIKNGMTVPPRLRLKTLFEMAMKVSWSWGVVRGKSRTFANVARYASKPEDLKILSRWIDSQLDLSLTWKDVEWIRSIWKGKLIVKGVLDTEDARQAVASGADAIVVSNHGGRQLDGAPSSIAMLPAIADAVAGSAEIMFDSGIRSGQDVVRALALGAQSCMIGRAYIHGLGAAGQVGVDRALAIIEKEMRVTMALMGAASLADLGRHCLVE